MVPFAGYDMPLTYPNLSITASTKHTREHCSLFDVSHMLQSSMKGAKAEEFLSHLVVADLDLLAISQSMFSVLTNANGGIIDDLIIKRVGKNEFYIVSNAGCRDKDIEHIKSQLKKFKGAKDVEFKEIQGMAL